MRDGKKLLAEFEDKVRVLAILISNWSGLGSHPDPEP